MVSKIDAKALGHYFFTNAFVWRKHNLIKDFYFGLCGTLFSKTNRFIDSTFHR